VGIPLSITCTPFAPLGPEDPSIPLVHLGASPPRCTRCRGYINASVAWREEGRKWECNLCTMLNDCPAWYYSGIDGAGRRLDESTRPELTRGSVDFLVGADYSTQPLQAPLLCLAIDVSRRAVESGFTAAAIAAAKAAVGELLVQESLRSAWMDDCALGGGVGVTGTGAPGVGMDRDVGAEGGKGHICAGATSVLSPSLLGARVGILTFDSQVQFYSARHSAATGGVAVSVAVTDEDNPVGPLPVAQWALSLSEPQEEAALQHLLNRLPELVDTLSESRGAACVGGTGTYGPTRGFGCTTAAVRAAQQLLKDEGCGGHVVVLTCSHPYRGYGGVRIRENAASYGRDEEFYMYASVAAMFDADADKVRIYCTRVQMGPAPKRNALQSPI